MQAARLEMVIGCIMAEYFSLFLSLPLKIWFVMDGATLDTVRQFNVCGCDLGKLLAGCSDSIKAAYSLNTAVN